MATIEWPDTGELNRRIRIRLWSDAPDLLTGIDQQFEPGVECWAKVQPVQGALYWAGKQINDETSHFFWVRYYDRTQIGAITGEHVVEWAGHRYRVLRAINAGDANAFTRIEARDLGRYPTYPIT